MEVVVVPVPGKQEDQGNAFANAMVEQLAFPPPIRSSFHGLPVRLMWHVWVQVMGWKFKEEAAPAATEELEARVEAGENAHYSRFSTPSRSGGTVAFEESFPRTLLTVYDARHNKVRLSVVKKGFEDQEKDSSGILGYVMYALRELIPGQPQVGYVSLKHPSKKDEKGRRVSVGRLRVGVMMSQSTAAPVLLLLDLRERVCLYFAGSGAGPTLEDLNPAMEETESSSIMTPFIWHVDKGENGLIALQKKEGRVPLCSLQYRQAAASTSVVTIVRVDPNTQEYWQCTITHDKGQPDLFSAEGSWHGVVQRAAWKFEMTPHGSKERVAHAEWRNSRDIKLSVDTPLLDPAVVISVFLAIARIQNGKV